MAKKEKTGSNNIFLNQGLNIDFNGNLQPEGTYSHALNLSDRSILRELGYSYFEASNEKEEKHLPLDAVAQKVISNAESSVEITELMASTFIQAVMVSALNPDETKQIIKYVDILEQWEENKWQLV